jgi:hypothetical protein
VKVSAGRRQSLALLAGAAVVLLCAAAAPAPTWLELFDGRTPVGWRMSGPGSFTVEHRALVTHGGMGLLWYERRRFRDFELEVEWKVAQQCANSGIFVRFPGRPASPLDAVATGYEVQIDDCDPPVLPARGTATGSGSSVSTTPSC